MKNTGRRVKREWRAYRARDGEGSLKAWARLSSDGNVKAWLDRKRQS